MWKELTDLQQHTLKTCFVNKIIKIYEPSDLWVKIAWLSEEFCKVSFSVWYPLIDSYCFGIKCYSTYRVNFGDFTFKERQDKHIKLLSVIHSKFSVRSECSKNFILNFILKFKKRLYLADGWWACLELVLL